VSLVLWGGRRGDVQYASREFWRRNLRVGVPTIEVDTAAWVDVGVVLHLPRPLNGYARDVYYVVDSMDGYRLAVLEKTRMEVVARGV
jgi:hypothetical protein